MLLVILKAMGFENITALVVDHLCLSGMAVCESLDRLGIEHEYADSFETAETLLETGRQTGHKWYDLIITETAAFPATHFANERKPVEAAVGADLPVVNVHGSANFKEFPVGPRVVKLARSHGQNPFVIAYYERADDSGLWTPANPCDCLITRNQAVRYDVLEKILKERFGG